MPAAQPAPDRNWLYLIVLPKWLLWQLFGWIWDLLWGWLLSVSERPKSESDKDRGILREYERLHTRDVCHRNDFAVPGYGTC
jgi:hypothetical protein